MLLLTLILVPLYGIFLIVSQFSKTDEHENIKLLKIISLAVTIIDLIISLVIYILFDFYLLIIFIIELKLIILLYYLLLFNYFY